MFCPECGGKTTVIDSRKVELVVARLRLCKDCGYSFYTEEVEVEDHEAIKYYRKVCKAKQRIKEVKSGIENKVKSY